MSYGDTYDTFENKIMERINRSLNENEFEQLNSNEWDDLYVKYFLNLYAQMCNLPGFIYMKHQQKTIEPVTLHVNVQQERKEKPVILHSISIPYLKWLYNCKSYRHVDVNYKCCFKLPSVFPLINTISENNFNAGRVLNSFVSNLLILYYVFADHAAYHYHQFIKKGDADYNHVLIKNRSNYIKIKEIQFCHDVITKKPNKNIVRYLQSHDTLKVDEKESTDSFMNISYSEIFEETDTDTDSSQ